MTFGSETGERVLKEGARLKEGCLFVLNSGIGGTLSRMSGLRRTSEYWQWNYKDKEGSYGGPVKDAGFRRNRHGLVSRHRKEVQG